MCPTLVPGCAQQGGRCSYWTRSGCSPPTLLGHASAAGWRHPAELQTVAGLGRLEGNPSAPHAGPRGTAHRASPCGESALRKVISPRANASRSPYTATTLAVLPVQAPCRGRRSTGRRGCDGQRPRSARASRRATRRTVPTWPGPTPNHPPAPTIQEPDHVIEPDVRGDAEALTRAAMREALRLAGSDPGR
jgi:hypothetical protein